MKYSTLAFAKGGGGGKLFVRHQQFERYPREKKEKREEKERQHAVQDDDNLHLVAARKEKGEGKFLIARQIATAGTLGRRGKG